MQIQAKSLRFCIYNKLPGEARAAGPLTELPLLLVRAPPRHSEGAGTGARAGSEQRALAEG